jgi:endonuclease YncB( thermonuclease family)
MAAEETTLTGKVVAVSDGDTIKVLSREAIKPEIIRLMSVDCPEKSQAFGAEAKDYTRSRCLSREVTVVRHGYDRNHRTIGDVILPDGEHLNAALVKAGLAWWYKKYAPGAKDLAALEEEAKNQKLGLWMDPQPTAPWDYRHTKRKPAQAISAASTELDHQQQIGDSAEAR